MIPPRSLPVTLLAIIIALPAHAEVTALSAGKDNTLFEDLSGSISNGIGSGLFAGTTAGVEPPGITLFRRALVWFDVASVVPGTAMIDSVFLTLAVTKTRDLVGTPVKLHEVQGSWGEGSSNAGDLQDGDGAQAQTGDATWIHRTFNSTFWAAPGGDYDPTPSATLIVAGPASYTWGSTPEMVADVQAWLDGVTENNGWIIIGDESTSANAKRIASRESTMKPNQPTLVVYYTPDMTPVEPTTWGAIKSLYR